MLTIETLAGVHEITPRFESGQVVAARVGMGAAALPTRRRYR